MNVDCYACSWVVDEEILLRPCYVPLAAGGMEVDADAELEERHAKDWEAT